jgi:predicted DNA-binding transcriptional regulator AlpA
MPRKSPEPSEIWLLAADVRKRYGDASVMWLDRRLKDDSGFPKPVYLGRQRYWRLSELEAWERDCARRSPARYAEYQRSTSHARAAMSAACDR